MQKFSKEEIGYARVFLQRSPKDSLKKEADEIIEFLQEQIKSLEYENKILLKHNEDIVFESDNRLQSLADQLAEAQSHCNDLMLKAKV